ncbi:hypothetical protein HDU79_006557 [Rhizoclosmatium sp. JEL0117]|nr:hypothetical protein HDU79_006557 [Rhizoclosmatium sp. JEL0117]
MTPTSSLSPPSLRRHSLRFTDSQLRLAALEHLRRHQPAQIQAAAKPSTTTGPTNIAATTTTTTTTKHRKSKKDAAKEEADTLFWRTIEEAATTTPNTTSNHTIQQEALPETEPQINHPETTQQPVKNSNEDTDSGNDSDSSLDLLASSQPTHSNARKPSSLASSFVARHRVSKAPRKKLPIPSITIRQPGIPEVSIPQSPELLLVVPPTPAAPTVSKQRFTHSDPPQPPTPLPKKRFNAEAFLDSLF